MSASSVGELVGAALASARISQRALSDKTGIAQATISRIISGTRQAKTTELILIAQATGHTYEQLTGGGITEDHISWAARSTDGSGMAEMKKAVMHFMDLDAYLTDQAISTAR